VGSYFFQRPDSLVPDLSRGSDRAIQRTRLRVPLEEPPATWSADEGFAVVRAATGS
jgi:hypothetical protein